MRSRDELVYRALRHPEVLSQLSTRQWDQLIRRARLAGVLSRLAVSSQRVSDESLLPEKARDHLAAARLVAAHHARTLRWEVNRIGRALESVCDSAVLLKGAAYELANLPPRAGRLASDVDILVPRSQIEIVEGALIQAGWKALKLDPYDQRYYRRWMHEIPPLRHETRNTVVDVHHAILPPTARRYPDPEKLLAGAVRLDARFAVLAPVDMVLHSATHLFADGDIAGGLREVIDIDALLRYFAGSDSGFWSGLVPRANELGLTRPLFYALRFCHRLLDTPIPREVLLASDAGGPRWLTVQAMDGLVERALLPDIKGSPITDGALWVLYVRSHWMRMPPWLLTRHLFRKAMRRWYDPHGA